VWGTALKRTEWCGMHVYEVGRIAAFCERTARCSYYRVAGALGQNAMRTVLQEGSLLSSQGPATDPCP
jgi:hypothetical protein